MERYHRALCREIEQFLRRYEGSRELETLFIGGGMPATYPLTLLLDTSGTLRKTFILKEDGEFTIEINPEIAHKEQLKVWHSIGINRLSIGVQSLNDHVRGRVHVRQAMNDACRLFSYATDYFSNLSVDIILSAECMAEWKQFVRTVVCWPITHVSIYMANSSDDTMADLYDWTVDQLAVHEFEQYELSNFAKPGYASKHQLMYGDHKPYKAFGLGGCSFDGTHRFQNETQLMRYIERIEQGADPTIFYETVTSEQRYLEQLMLGLRRRSGVCVQEVLKNLTCANQQRFKNVVASLKEGGWLQELDDRLFLTRAGLMVENEILIRLTQ